MQGYSCVSLVHPDIYRWLKTNGHLTKLLDRQKPNSDVRKRIVQHIAVQYLEGEEALEGNNPFSHILRNWNLNDISVIVWLFWQEAKNEVSQTRRQRVLDFWKWCSEKMRSQEQDNAPLLSDLCLLAAYVSEIGQQEEVLLLQAAPYADVKHHSSFFIEYLDGLVVAFPRAVSQTYLAMLKKALPTFDAKNIRSLVEKLYAANLKHEANEIVNVYAKNNNELIRDIDRLMSTLTLIRSEDV